MGLQGKKRKREPHSSHVDTSKPTAVFKPATGRPYTLSLALPGSIIANAQTQELKTALAGQIARALAVFCVDEVIIFDDGQGKKDTRSQSHSSSNVSKNHQNDNHYVLAAAEQVYSYTGVTDPDHFLLHILSYLETPPHLRRYLFPMHPNLRFAGALPSLDMPHHLRANEWCQYREGVTVAPSPALSKQRSSVQGETKTLKNKKGKGKKRKDIDEAAERSDIVACGTSVEVGLPRKALIQPSILLNTRVTVKFPSSHDLLAASTDTKEETDAYFSATAVHPSAPRTEVGYYWGYTCRLASSLSAVFTESPFVESGGYDFTIGTSERGEPLREVIPRIPSTSYEHLLLCFGGVSGLEAAAGADEELKALGIEGPDVGKLFDAWVDLVPGQGSRTVRTEEAVWIGLMGLRGVVDARGVAPA